MLEIIFDKSRCLQVARPSSKRNGAKWIGLREERNGEWSDKEEKDQQQTQTETNWSESRRGKKTLENEHRPKQAANVFVSKWARSVQFQRINDNLQWIILKCEPANDQSNPFKEYRRMRVRTNERVSARRWEWHTQKKCIAFNLNYEMMSFSTKSSRRQHLFDFGWRMSVAEVAISRPKLKQIKMYI